MNLERLRKLARSLILEPAVQSFGFAVDPPRFDGPLRIGQAGEPMLVEAFVAEGAVEALDERVLGRFARMIEVQHHVMRGRPVVEVRPRELGPVITDNRVRIAAPAPLSKSCRIPMICFSVHRLFRMVLSGGGPP